MLDWRRSTLVVMKPHETQKTHKKKEEKGSDELEIGHRRKTDYPHNESMKPPTHESARR